MNKGKTRPIRSVSEEVWNFKGENNEENESVPAFHSTPEKYKNADRRKSSLQPDSYYTCAAKRLQRAIFSMAKEDGCSSDLILHSILEEVSKDDNVNPQDLLQKVQTNLESVSVSPSTVTSGKKSSVVSDSINFDSILHEDSDFEDNAFSDDQDSSKSGLAKIAQLVALGSMDLEDIGDVLEKTSVKSNFDTLIEYVLIKLREEWGYFFDVMVPLKQIHTMLFIGIFQIISVNQVLKTLPIVLSFVSFFGMVYFTLKMFRCRNSIRNIVVWKRLLTIFAKPANGDSENKIARSSESSLYNWTSLEPYMNFFLVLLAFVVSFALAGHSIPNLLSLFGISLFFSLLCFVALPDHFDGFTLVALLLDLVSSLPIILARFGAFPNSSRFVKNFYEVNLGAINLNLSLPSIAFVFLLILFLVIFVTYAKVDFYQVVIPHTICLFWWHVTLMLFSFTNFDVVWSNVVLTVGILWLILFPTTVALTIVGAIIFTQFNIAINFVNVCKCLITLLIVFLPLLYKKFATYAHSSELVRRRKTFFLFVFYVILVFFCAAIMYHGNVTVNSERSSDLTWNDFDKYCASGEEAFDNRLNQQIMCTELMGVVVSWKGAIQSVKIIKVENFMEYLLGYCPSFIAEWLRCFYGSNIYGTNKLFTLAHRNCSTTRHNVYSFQIEVSGPWGQKMISSAKSTIILTASDRFKQTLLHLRESDVISFTAVFDDYLLRHPAKLRLLTLRCVSCRNMPILEKEIKAHKETVNRNFWSKLFYSMQYLFNFAFNPLLTMN